MRFCRKIGASLADDHGNSQRAKDFGPAAVPEMPDRIIAATARALDVPLLTTDPAIAESGLVKVAE
jgi:predicted nucleic acid-binding protein